MSWQYGDPIYVNDEELEVGGEDYDVFAEFASDVFGPPSLKETARDVFPFIAKVLGVVLFTAAIMAVFAFGIWREFLLVDFLMRS